MTTSTRPSDGSPPPRQRGDSMSLFTDLFRSATDDAEYREAAERRALERAAAASAARDVAGQDSHDDLEPAVHTEVSEPEPDPPAGDEVQPPTQPRRPVPMWRTPRIRASVLLTVGIAVLALLLVTTAIQTRRAAPAAAEQRASLVQRIEQVEADVARLGVEVTLAEERLADAQGEALAASDVGEVLAAELDALALASGATAVTGPGVVITVDDAEHDPDDPTGGDGHVQAVDLQQVLNGLWSAGAEAVSIGGTRVTARTSVRTAGEAIVVDLAPLRPPYVVVAIGDPETLAPQFLESFGASWLQTIAAEYGVRYDVRTDNELNLPSASRTELDYATADVRNEEAGA